MRSSWSLARLRLSVLPLWIHPRTSSAWASVSRTLTVRFVFDPPRLLYICNVITQLLLAPGCSSQSCYTCRMTEVASRELRNNTRALLERVEAGEEVTITVDGRPVAALHPVGRRPRWLGRDEFVRRIGSHQADAAVARELTELAPDTTDDIPL